jgi:hypothetical protein
MKMARLDTPRKPLAPALSRSAGEIASEPRARTTFGQNLRGCGTLTRLAALSTLSRNAGEGGPSATRWVGEGLDVAHRHPQSLAALFAREGGPGSTRWVGEGGGARQVPA